MKTLLFTAALLLSGLTASEPDRIEERLAHECEVGGGCYLVPKAAIEKMRGLILEQNEQLETQEKVIEKLHKKIDRSCA